MRTLDGIAVGIVVLGICLVAVGCRSETTSNAGAVAPAKVNYSKYATGGDPTDDDPFDRYVEIEAPTIPLFPQNTAIDFHGRKGRDESHPGGFGEFKGKLQLNEALDAVESIQVEIETDSIWTDNTRLTNHLMSPDFFNVRKHPTATFTTTEITPHEEGGGKLNITGDLTLLGTTKAITFPAKLDIVDSKLQLTCNFALNRKEFGMTFSDEVDAEVLMSVVVGAPTQIYDPSLALQNVPGADPGAGGGGGGGEGGAGGGRRGGFDPVARFKEWDADSDGKLTGDEIPERMRQDLEGTDADKDGSVTLEEFQERLKNFRRQRGGGGGGGGSIGIDVNNIDDVEASEKKRPEKKRPEKDGGQQ